MSFSGFKQGLKRFKDSVTSPTMNFAIALPKDTYFLGEEVKGNIVLRPSEPVEIERAVIRLSCVESVKETRRVKQGDRSYDKEYVKTAQLCDKPLVFNYQPTFSVNPGEERRQPFTITVPLTGRPTFNSVNSNIDWNISVDLQPKGRRNLAQSYRIQVAAVPYGQTTPTPILQKETITEVEIIYCSHCGTKNNARTQYCTSCGAPLR